MHIPLKPVLLFNRCIYSRVLGVVRVRINSNPRSQVERTYASTISHAIDAASHESTKGTIEAVPSILTTPV